MPRNNSLKKISMILVIMVIIPSLFYTASEISTYNENEELLNQVYKQQLDVILFSVNQHAWDYVNSWISKLDLIISRDNEIDKKANGAPHFENVKNFIISQPVFNQITFYDSAFTKLSAVYPNEYLNNKLKADQENYIAANNNKLKKLLSLKSQDYRKIETFVFESDTSISSYIGLVYITELRNQTYYAVLVMDSDFFINNTITKKLTELAGANLVCAVFNEKTKEPISSTQFLAYDDALVRKKLWIFPNHTLGIGFTGFSLGEFTNQRMIRSALLILAVNLILILGIWYVYKNTQREIQLAQLKSDFVSNVSHELRTPLSIIRMYAETLEMDRISSNKKRMEYYKNISHEADRLTHLINNILNFSRIESGSKEYKFEKIAVNSLVEDILQTYKESINEKGFELHLKLSSRDPVIFADKGAVTECIINLIDNALKYSGNKRYIAVSTEQNDKYILIGVQDQGLGIQTDNRQKIFEKFYRESNPLVHNTKGSGLGLSIVKHNMQAHHGEVTLESEAGKGSLFKLCFPINRSSNV